MDESILLQRQIYRSTNKIQFDQKNYSYRFAKENTRDKVIEDFSNFWMLLLILTMTLNELILADTQIGEHLIVKVHVFFHSFYFLQNYFSK